MKVRYLKPAGKTAQRYKEAVARARGCMTETEIAEFLNPLPAIRNNISLLPDYQRASERLQSAITRHERVILFGDWDSDGILSLVQMYDLIKATGHEELHWFIPDRRSEDYGLTIEAVTRCFEQFRPDLIVAVDCGSPSHESTRWLREHNVDTIIIDHHQLGSNTEPHPAIAHLNPKAYSDESQAILELREMSASGLVYLFSEQFVHDAGIEGWDQIRALILGGIGTVVDVVKLVGVNRALAKSALHLASKSEELGRVPGLIALNDVAKGGPISPSTFGFVWGPRLNATGRLEEATVSLKLLLSKSVEEARPWAEHCHAANEERRKIQADILAAATAQANELIQRASEEASRVLVLFDQTWNPGVVGIVASRIKEQYARPTIVLGWHDDGFCKGSGRSIPAYNMGNAIYAATKAGVITSGGGHHMAAGLKTELHQIDALREWLNSNCSLSKKDFIPDVEVLGRCESLTPDEWCDVFDALEPFGNGNPKPSLYLSKAELIWGPDEMKAKDGSLWALKAGFKVSSRMVLYCMWTDVVSARSQWRRGHVYNMALNLSRTKKERGTYFNWRVTLCESL